MNLLLAAYYLMCFIVLCHFICYAVARSQMPNVSTDDFLTKDAKKNKEQVKKKINEIETNETNKINQINKRIEKEEQKLSKVMLINITNMFILGPAICGFIVCFIIGCCIAMNTTRFYFLLWIILIIIFIETYVFIIVMFWTSYSDVLNEAYDEIENDKLRRYLKLISGMSMGVFISNLVFFGFLFFAILMHKGYRVPAPKVHHVYHTNLDFKATPVVPKQV